MGAPGFHHSVASRANLDEAIATSPPHLQVIFEAVRDRSIRFGHVRQHGGAFTFPAGLPIVLLLSDDYDLAWGPQAFDRRSLKRFLKSATAASIVAGAPELTPYAAAVAGAVLTGRNSLIVETTERWEGEWIALLRDLAPGLPTLLSTPLRAGAVH